MPPASHDRSWPPSDYNTIDRVHVPPTAPMAGAVAQSQTVGPGGDVSSAPVTHT